MNNPIPDIAFYVGLSVALYAEMGLATAGAGVAFTAFVFGTIYETWSDDDER